MKRTIIKAKEIDACKNEMHEFESSPPPPPPPEKNSISAEENQH